MVRFVVNGNIPAKKNRYRVRFNFKTKKPFIAPDDVYKNWNRNAKYIINTQKTDYPDIDFPIKKCESITVIIYYGTLIKKDNSNVIESIHDLLVDAGVLIDDNWQVTGETLQIPKYRKGSPGAEIIIKIPDLHNG